METREVGYINGSVKKFEYIIQGIKTSEIDILNNKFAKLLNFECNCIKAEYTNIVECQKLMNEFEKNLAQTLMVLCTQHAHPWIATLDDIDDEVQLDIAREFAILEKEIMRITTHDESMVISISTILPYIRKCRITVFGLKQRNGIDFQTAEKLMDLMGVFDEVVNVIRAFENEENFIKNHIEDEEWTFESLFYQSLVENDYKSFFLILRVSYDFPWEVISNPANLSLNNNFFTKQRVEFLLTNSHHGIHILDVAIEIGFTIPITPCQSLALLTNALMSPYFLEYTHVMHLALDTCHLSIGKNEIDEQQLGHVIQNLNNLKKDSVVDIVKTFFHDFSHDVLDTIESHEFTLLEHRSECDIYTKVITSTHSSGVTRKLDLLDAYAHRYTEEYIEFIANIYDKYLDSENYHGFVKPMLMNMKYIFVFLNIEQTIDHMQISKSVDLGIDFLGTMADYLYNSHWYWFLQQGDLDTQDSQYVERTHTRKCESTHGVHDADIKCASYYSCHSRRKSTSEESYANPSTLQEVDVATASHCRARLDNKLNYIHTYLSDVELYQNLHNEHQKYQ